jgi:O-antigen ligase
VPLSFLLVKYFPDVGRAYDRWTYKPIVVGASTDKNSLGATLLICALGVFWSFLDLQKQKARDKWHTLAHVLLMAMNLWLLYRSNCATALTCVIVGCGILLGMQLSKMRSLTQRLGLSVFIAVPVLMLCLNLVFDLGETFVGMVGRDSTLTGRGDIWKASLRAEVNPLIGAGYCSFWYGERAKTISEGLGFFFDLKEAHNGYLETYLNVGLLGLSLLLAALVAGTSRIFKRIESEGYYQALRLTFVVVALIYNVSESAFSGLNLIWFVLLVSIFEHPRSRLAAVDKQVELSGNGVNETQLGHSFASSQISATSKNW